VDFQDANGAELLDLRVSIEGLGDGKKFELFGQYKIGL
jgi:hypothetical protein